MIDHATILSLSLIKIGRCSIQNCFYFIESDGNVHFKHVGENMLRESRAIYGKEWIVDLKNFLVKLYKKSERIRIRIHW